VVFKDGLSDKQRSLPLHRGAKANPTLEQNQLERHRLVFEHYTSYFVWFLHKQKKEINASSKDINTGLYSVNGDRCSRNTGMGQH
jgi:hypothetical protein